MLGSALTFGGRPTRRLGGSGGSDALDMTDCDRLMSAAGVPLLSRGNAFLVDVESDFGGRPTRRLGLSSTADS